MSVSFHSPPQEPSSLYNTCISNAPNRQTLQVSKEHTTSQIDLEGERQKILGYLNTKLEEQITDYLNAKEEL